MKLECIKHSSSVMCMSMNGCCMHACVSVWYVYMMCEASAPTKGKGMSP